MLDLTFLLNIDTVNIYGGRVTIEVNVSAIVRIAYNPITNHLLNALEVNPKTGMVFAGLIEIESGGTNVYRSTPDILKDIVVVSVDNPADLPTDYSLSQNYPNPFNPTTKIQYSLTATTNVKLSVYNIMGQEVMQLVNEDQTAGKYIVDFDAQNLQSGVYFYRLQTGKFVETKKMLLLK